MQHQKELHQKEMFLLNICFIALILVTTAVAKKCNGHSHVIGNCNDNQDSKLLNIKENRIKSSIIPSNWLRSNNNLDVSVTADMDPKEKEEAMKFAVKNTIITMGAGILFGFGTWKVKDRKAAMEYFTAFLVEKSLSIDNLFVFLMLFDYFQIPYKLQNRVLTWGLIGAVVMRGIMIFVGVQAIQKFKWVTLFFAGILILSAYKLFHEDEAEADPSQNAVMKLSKMIMPAVDHLDGENFFTKDNTGKRFATPLLTCLICIELSDFVFAVDSIPAVIGVSKDPFIVYSSNIFAILGLRSLYILISQAVSELRYIRPAVATVLGFVGAKMIAEYFHYEISAFHSLLVILAILTTGLLASIRANNIDKMNNEIKK